MNSNFESIATSSFRVFALGCALLVFGPASAFAAAGKIQFTAGEVKIVNAQKAEREAKKGEALETGDTIVTGTSGSVQVALADGGLIAVRPNSQLKIDDYAYAGKPDDSKNKSIFSLGKGTFRSITGAIGQNNKETYRVNTPTATMGIRGTDHEPAVVLPVLSGEQAQTPLQAAPPGTYDRVNSGTTFIQNPQGIVVLEPNQVGFASSTGGAPVVLPQLPGFYTNTPQTNPAKAAADAKKTDSAAGGASGTTASASGDSSGSTTTTSASAASADGESTVAAFGSDSVSTISTGTDTSVATSQTIATTPSLAVAAGFPTSSFAPLGSGLVGTYVDSSPMGFGGADSIFLENPPRFTQEILLGAQNEVLRIFDGESPTFEFQSNNSSLTDQGSRTFNDGARVDWGRWVPGYTVLEGGVAVPTIGDFQYIFSRDITSVTFLESGTLTGTIGYGHAGGPQPTDLAGNLGMIDAASTALYVNFTDQFVTLSVGVTFGGPVLSGVAAGPIRAFIDPNGGIFSNPQSNTFLKANGLFVGPTASGAITAFDIRDSAGNGATGTAVFDRSLTPSLPPPVSSPSPPPPV